MVWNRTTLAIGIPALLLLTGCARSVEQGEAALAPRTGFILADTSWELVALSANETQGAKSERVDAGLYTMLIRGDGTVAFRLDCNRGFGRWKGSASSDQRSGSIVFSGLGVTKALCPPQSISDRVTADLSKFDSFSIENGDLVLKGEPLAVAYRWAKAAESPTSGGKE